MATYSGNTTIKVSTAVDATGAYTAPSNGYAILFLYVASGSGTVSYNGVTITGSLSSGLYFIGLGTGANGSGGGLYVGPSVTVDFVAGSGAHHWMGVEFKNSP